MGVTSELKSILPVNSIFFIKKKKNILICNVFLVLALWGYVTNSPASRFSEYVIFNAFLISDIPNEYNIFNRGKVCFYFQKNENGQITIYYGRLMVKSSIIVVYRWSMIYTRQLSLYYAKIIHAIGLTGTSLVIIIMKILLQMLLKYKT